MTRAFFLSVLIKHCHFAGWSSLGGSRVAPGSHFCGQEAPLELSCSAQEDRIGGQEVAMSAKAEEQRPGLGQPWGS